MAVRMEMQAGDAHPEKAIGARGRVRDLETGNGELLTDTDAACHARISGPVGIAFVDGGFRFRRINDPVAEFTGRPVEAHAGRALAEVVPAPFGMQLEALCRRTLAAHRAVGTLEFSVERRDFAAGRRDWLIACEPAAPEFAGSGVILVILDVTARRAAEQALVRLASELETRIAERTAELVVANAQLDQFARTAAHDLRAPLRRLQSLVAAFIEDHGHALPAGAHSWVGSMAQQADRMERLIAALLEYAAVGQGGLDLEDVLLEDVARSVLIDYDAPAIVPGASVELHGLGARVRAHPELLRRALANLVDNALKFATPGSPPRVVVSAVHVGAAVRTIVADNGVGFDAREHRHVFEPFTRLHPDRTGTGIGLAIVKTAIERMGGSVGADSSPGHGSRFWIDLPAAAAGAPRG